MTSTLIIRPTYAYIGGSGFMTMDDGTMNMGMDDNAMAMG